MKYDKTIWTIIILVAFVVAVTATSPYSFNLNDGNLFEPLEIINSPSTNLDVIVGDQTSPPIIIYMNKVDSYAELTANFTLNSYNITVNDSTGFAVGGYTGVFNRENIKYYAGNILEINGNVLSMDTPSDFDFVTGDAVQSGIKNMNVDGSGTPVIFSLRADPDLNFTIDVTRIIIHITDNLAMDDERFGGIAALERGVVLRRIDGTYQNIFNVKTNGEFGELAFDKAYDDKAPAGFFGFSSRLTFAGSNKMGVAIRLDPGEDLQVIIQDDLTDLNKFVIMVEGHVVID